MRFRGRDQYVNRWLIDLDRVECLPPRLEEVVRWMSAAVGEQIVTTLTRILRNERYMVSRSRPFTTSDVHHRQGSFRSPTTSVRAATRVPMSEPTKSARRHTMSCDRQKQPRDHQCARFRHPPRFRSDRDQIWGKCNGPRHMRRLVPSPLNSRGQFEHAHHAKSSHRHVLHRAYAPPKLVNAASDIGTD